MLYGVCSPNAEEAKSRNSTRDPPSQGGSGDDSIRSPGFDSEVLFNFLNEVLINVFFTIPAAVFIIREEGVFPIGVDHQKLRYVVVEEEAFDGQGNVVIPLLCPPGLVVVHSMKKVDDGKSPIRFLVVGRRQENAVWGLLTQCRGSKVTKLYPRSSLQLDGLRCFSRQGGRLFSWVTIHRNS